MLKSKKKYVKYIFLNIQPFSCIMSVYIKKYYILGDTFTSTLFSQATANFHPPKISTQSEVIG